MSRKNKKKVYDEVYKRKYPSWDYAYFLKLQYNHLEKMYKFFNGPDTHIEAAKEVAKDIKQAMTILSRVIKDDYILYYSWIDADFERADDLATYHKILQEKLWRWWD